jgi:hypothetical protein
MWRGCHQQGTQKDLYSVGFKLYVCACVYVCVCVFVCMCVCEKGYKQGAIGRAPNKFCAVCVLECKRMSGCGGAKQDAKSVLSVFRELCAV